MEELERKCMICGHVFTLESRGRKKKTCPACRERILQEHDKYEAEFNRRHPISVSYVASR